MALHLVRQYLFKKNRGSQDSLEIRCKNRDFLMMSMFRPCLNEGTLLKVFKDFFYSNWKLLLFERVRKQYGNRCSKRHKMLMLLNVYFNSAI